MLNLRRLQDLPDNFQEYVAEIADGLSALYGPEAAAEYRQMAPRAVRQAIRSYAVDAIALQEGLRRVFIMPPRLREA